MSADVSEPCEGCNAEAGEVCRWGCSSRFDTMLPLIQMVSDDVQAFIDYYIMTILWANTYTEDDETLEFPSGDAEPYCREYAERVTQEARDAMRDDCVNFLDNEVVWILEQVAPLGYTYSQAGHDFALTRNGHGAGFWDRGLGRYGERLTGLSKAFGEYSLYDNGTEIMEG